MEGEIRMGKLRFATRAGTSTANQEQRHDYRARCAGQDSGRGRQSQASDERGVPLDRNAAGRTIYFLDPASAAGFVAR